MKADSVVNDSRDRIVRAAARVFSEAGYRGATTRRIAAAAGVNEVTLFRHFGSKDELIREAIAFSGRRDDFTPLPARPEDPAMELTTFSREQLHHLFRVRSLIRTCMGEGNERPEILSRATDRPISVHRELLAYLRRLQSAGFADGDADVEAAATTLMGALFSDAMGRDYMPEAFSYSIEEAPARYVALILKAVGQSGESGRSIETRDS